MFRAGSLNPLKKEEVMDVKASGLLDMVAGRQELISLQNS